MTREQSAPVTNMSIENPLSASVPAIQQDFLAEVSSKRTSRKNSSQEVRARKRRAKMKKLLLPIETVQQHHSASVPAAFDASLSASLSLCPSGFASVPAAQQHHSASVPAASDDPLTASVPAAQQRHSASVPAASDDPLSASVPAAQQQ